jgi:monofunctional glycosyltransferase
MRHVFYGLLYSVIIILIMGPFYLYFSHDVAKLKDNYPHRLSPVIRVPEFEIKSDKPKGWVKLKEISAYGKWAIILSEDWGFYQHHGIDLNQIKVALSDMINSRRFRGASTITQQLVKNLYLADEHTIFRKFHEIVLAQKLEKEISKDRILELYFNCIEFGPEVYGIKNASYHYFGKHPKDITAREGAFLAMLLPSPKRYYISFKKKALTQFAKNRIDVILAKMRMGGVITPDQFEEFRMVKMAWEN